MKKVFFVRHGESEGNTGAIWPTDVTPLTHRGRTQSAEVGKRLAIVTPDAIISSPLRRAAETSVIISAAVGVHIEYIDIFIERRQPSEVIGQPKADTRVATACRLIDDNFHVSGFRLSDEETFDDLKFRSHRALTYLATRPESKIVVVTHGFFLRVLLSHILLGREIAGSECANVVRCCYADHSSISVAEFYEASPCPTWRVRSWNDTSHLSHSQW